MAWSGDFATFIEVRLLPYVSFARIEVGDGNFEWFECLLGQPRRHLLTTGWSAFVNKKKLVSGDAVLFLR